MFTEVILLLYYTLNNTLQLYDYCFIHNLTVFVKYLHRMGGAEVSHYARGNTTLVFSDATMLWYIVFVFSNSIRILSLHSTNGRLV